MLIPAISFKLAQLGSWSAGRWADRLRGIGLTPGEGAVLRILDSMGAVSQRDLAVAMDIVASRIVVVIDALEAKGLVERVRSPHDRRRYDLVLTSTGRDRLTELQHAGREHERELTKTLSAEQRTLLDRLLAELAEANGLRPGVHPQIGSTPERKARRGTRA